MAPSIREILKYPLPVLARKAVNLGKQKLSDKIKRPKALNHEHRTHGPNQPIAVSRINLTLIPTDSIPENVAELLIERFCAHRFDLLGSGWVFNGYLDEAPGLEHVKLYQNISISNFDDEGNWLSAVVTPAHLPESKRYWKIVRKLIPEYHPIDWQKDFKSGFRWSAQQWGKDQRAVSDQTEGADLKSPWELSRLQHLPQLAILAKRIPQERTRIVQQFIAQTLDFFAANPPEMGVNYNCAMDVGIRAANLCLAFDLFKQLDSDGLMNAEFCDIFTKNIYQHGKSILADIEYREGMTSNHYLGNVAGMAWIAAYLPDSPEIRQWLAFATEGIITEMKRQFLADGGNFEGSTSYHRLSGEMMTWSIALLAGMSSDRKAWLTKYSTSGWKCKAPLLPASKCRFDANSAALFPDWVYDTLHLALKFTQSITKPNGEIAQFGDNDSGRFFRITPVGKITDGSELSAWPSFSNYFRLYPKDEPFWKENHLNHSPFVGATAALFQGESAPELGQVEYELANQLARCYHHRVRAFQVPVKVESMDISGLNYSLTKSFELGRTVVAKSYGFPVFGVYGLNGDGFSLSISAIANRELQHFHWGHVHNDKLSFELFVDGKDLVLDGGTYLYTPIWQRRNEFRGVSAHPIPVVEGEEQNRWESGRRGLFTMERDSQLSLIEYSDSKISLLLKYRDTQILRTWELLGAELKVTDKSNKPIQQNWPMVYSPGYGERIR